MVQLGGGARGVTAAAVPLDFRVGARTLWSVRRRLQRVGWSLDDALVGGVAALPAPEAGSQGWLLTSLPESTLTQVVRPGFFVAVRQRYRRYYTDLDGTYDAWLAGLSGNARSAVRRKGKRLAAHPDGVQVHLYRSPRELEVFRPLARPLAARTYQERLLGMGLPENPAFLAEERALAAADRVRAWLMLLGGRPIAYLWCSAEGGSLRYDHLGYDPDHAELSPGTVLLARAFADLFAEGRFRRFDFTEGEGRHKRQFATGGVDCADALLLRGTLANRALAGALGGFDGGVALAKRAARHPRLAVLARRVARAA